MTDRRTSRRAFLGQAVGTGLGAGIGLGASALAQGVSGAAPLRSLLDGSYREGDPPPHHAPRAKRVIYLYMSGGPSQFETFDYKPALAKMDGEPMPESFTKGKQLAQLQGEKLKCLGPQFAFRQCGESGQWISDALPHTQKIADKICIVRSMTTKQINHDPAHTMMNTGTSISGRPSMGAWINWGLGSDCEDLPGFVVMTSVGGRNPQPIASRQWHSGFLPGRHQGVEFQSKGDPVHYVRNPPGIDVRRQRDVVDALAKLDREQLGRTGDPETRTRIAQYALALRMQASIPDLMDFSDEPQHVLDMYGVKGPDGSFATNCLVARRLAERGVRFIQLYHRGWDHHQGVVKYLKVCAGLTDQASAALITDLEQRGMLDDTLVVWGGEFGRTPMFQAGRSNKPHKDGPGRDHHISAFSVWLAGGGFKQGFGYGETDELGYGVAENEVQVHDLHATMLWQLGIDHERLTFRAQGRDHRLTDVHGHVVHDLLA